MPITPYSSSDLTRSRNNRQIYSGYRINVQANQLGIPAIPTTIKGASGDIVQSLREGPVNFTPTELAAILNNNSGSTAPSGPPGPPPQPPLTITSNAPPTFPYTIPALYTLITFTLIGGGGGGGGNYDFNIAGGGGGAAYIRARFSVNAGSVFTFTKGDGGDGAVTNNQTTIGYGENGTSTTISYNGGAIVVNAGGGGGGGGNGGGSGGGGGTVTGNTSSVTTILSTPGTPGGNGIDDFTNGIFTPGEGGLAGGGAGVAGVGGAGSGSGSGIPGTSGYWEFTLT